MAIPQEANDYIRESIEGSLGLPISEKTLRLKLFASEDERHRLQDQIFFLQDQLKESQQRLQLCREEARMNAQGLRNCIQEKEMICGNKAEIENYCAKLERECMLYERDLERALESCDEMEKETKDLRAQLHDFTVLAAQVKCLNEDKENLLINLQRAEEEVKVLFEDNKLLEEENKRLLRHLQREKQRHGSGSKPTTCNAASSKFVQGGKRKSNLMEGGSPLGGREIDFSSGEKPRHPLTPLHQNSPSAVRSIQS